MPAAVRTLVRIDDQGTAWIEGTTTRVIQVALDKLTQGWDADEIHAQHPYLSLAHIHAALSYYYDHQEELDAEIEHDYQGVEKLRVAATRQLTRSELEERLKNQTQ